MKPSVCSYTSLFVMTTVQQVYRILEDSSDSYEQKVTPYARDYCRNLEITVTKKLAFINKIK